MADAFLQVPQPVPRVVKIGNLELVILMCLPGQRDAAKLWYQHFTNVLQKEVQCDDLCGTTLRDEDSEKMCDGFTCG